MKRSILRAGVAVTLAVFLLGTAGSAQTTRKDDSLPRRNVPFTPKFAALAETRLIMEGLTNSNYQSLHRLLKNKPTDVETWAFARGQALIVAETGNLLLLRPPRNNGRESWMKLAMAMRDESAELARKTAAQNHAQSKIQLQNVTNACNRCHQTFRVNVKVGPAAEEKNAE